MTAGTTVAIPRTNNTLAMMSADSAKTEKALRCEPCRGDQEPRDGDPNAAVTPDKPAGKRRQQHGRKPGETDEQHAGFVESELGPQERTECGVHGDEAQQHGERSEVESA